jgi:HAD superfamily hydrolase (TIGR01484 family)
MRLDLKLDVFIFDVDGVLSNQDLKINPELIKKIAAIIDSQTPVAFITGRPYLWLKENFLDSLTSHVLDPQHLDNIFAEAEFGARIIKFTNGQEGDSFNKDLVISDSLKSQAHQISNEFLNTMWLEDKESMFTIVRKTVTPLEEYAKLQKELIEKLSPLVADTEFEINYDSNAINVRSKKANKKEAAKNVTEWIKSLGKRIDQYLVFGDSPSDLEMKEELDNEGILNKFIFVGNPSVLNNTENVIITSQRNDLGTLEFLESLE